MFRKAKPALLNIPESLQYSFLAGIWEDAVGMKRCKFTPSVKHGGYIVTEDRKNREKKKSTLTFTDYNGENRVILTAPWGENSKLKAWEGVVKDNGTKIIWKGWRGTQTWFKISGTNVGDNIIFDPVGRNIN
jgi:hypothetical protein